MGNIGAFQTLHLQFQHENPGNCVEPGLESAMALNDAPI
jgi:hypothetical protein